MARDISAPLMHGLKKASPTKSVSPVVELSVPAPDPGHDRFIPIPPNGRVCPISGLKHAALYRLLVHGPARRHVRVANLRQPGQMRAQTLFHVGDLIAYLSQLAEAQRPEDGSKFETEEAAA